MVTMALCSRRLWRVEMSAVKPGIKKKVGRDVPCKVGIVHSASSRLVVSAGAVMNGCAFVVSFEMSAGEMLLAAGCGKRLCVSCVLVVVFLNLCEVFSCSIVLPTQRWVGGVTQV